MVKVVNNDQLVCKVVIWACFGISLWTEKVALSNKKRYILFIELYLSINTWGISFKWTTSYAIVMLAFSLNLVAY